MPRDSHKLEKILSRIDDERTCPVALLMRDSKMLTGYRNYKDKWKNLSVWTIPGGRCDEGESVEQTLRREVAEEVGIVDLEIKSFLGEAPGAKDGDVVLVFYCTTMQEARLMEPEKFSEWRWITKDDYLSGAYSGFNPHVRKLIVDFFTAHLTEP